MSSEHESPESSPSEGGLGPPSEQEWQGGDFSSESVASDSPSESGTVSRRESEDEPHHRAESPNMLPARETRRTGLERMLVRLVATGGVIGIGVVISAIMTSSHSLGWVIGLVVSIVTVVLSAILWSSRQL
jgi:hypothetical protein